MSRKARKFKAFFRPKLGDLQKKKKKKVFAKIQSDFSAEIRNSKVFFRPKLGHLHKKKKKKKERSLLKVRPVFHPNSLHFPAESLMPNLQRGGPCLNFAHFTMQFCIPSDPKGGPWHNGPPPLNTPLLPSIWTKSLTIKIVHHNARFLACFGL